MPDFNIKKPVLLLLDGICKESYVESDLINSELYKKIKDKYKHIKRLETNEILDWGLVGGDFVLKYTDVVRFLASPIRRIKVTDLIEKNVRFYNSLGFPVHLYAHSLGTLKALDSNIEVDKLILAGCPIEFVSNIGTKLVQTLVNPIPFKGPKIKCKELFYLWSVKDLVSCRFPKKLDKFVQCEKNLIIQTNQSHDNINYLNTINDLNIL
jgi:hypothetical protein